MKVYKGPPTEQGSDVPGLNGTWQHTNSLSWLHSVDSVPIIPLAIDRYLYMLSCDRQIHHMNMVMVVMARKRVCGYAVVHTASSDAQNTIAC
jgi:hypothetical protein